MTRRSLRLVVAITAITGAMCVNARVRFVFNTAADFAYRWIGPAGQLEVAGAHPMRYLFSPPARGRVTHAIVIALDGSDRDFRGLHAAFVRARRDLPFALVTPFVLSNGPRPDSAAYPYTRREFEAAVTNPLAFDEAGIDAIIRDIRARSGADLPVYVTGFSAGGHLAWSLAIDHPELLAGVAFASANFAERDVSATRSGGANSNLRIRGFFGDADSRGEALLGQWQRACAIAQMRGYRDVERVVIPGAGHSPFARPVIEYFAASALGNTRQPS